MGVVTINEIIYVVGGNSGSGAVNLVEAFN